MREHVERLVAEAKLSRELGDSDLEERLGKIRDAEADAGRARAARRAEARAQEPNAPDGDPHAERGPVQCRLKSKTPQRSDPSFRGAGSSRGTDRASSRVPAPPITKGASALTWSISQPATTLERLEPTPTPAVALSP